MNELELRESFGTARPTEMTAILALASAPSRADIEEARAAKAAADAEAERRETLAMLNASNGNPIAKRSAAQQQVGTYRDRVASLGAELTRAQRDLDRAQANLDYIDSEVEQVMTAASRSSGTDLLTPAKQAHAEYVAASRAAWTAATTGAPRRAPRPKEVSRSLGVARRSEYCVHCTAEGVSDEDSYLLHSDPELACPVTSPEQAATAEQAGRSRGGAKVTEQWPREFDHHGRVISR